MCLGSGDSQTCGYCSASMPPRLTYNVQSTQKEEGANAAAGAPAVAAPTCCTATMVSAAPGTALDNFHAKNESEMLCIPKMLRSATVVMMNTGSWRWLESGPYPSWDAVRKCPLWSAEEWKAVGTALSKPETNI